MESGRKDLEMEARSAQLNVAQKLFNYVYANSGGLDVCYVVKDYRYQLLGRFEAMVMNSRISHQFKGVGESIPLPVQKGNTFLGNSYSKPFVMTNCCILFTYRGLYYRRIFSLVSREFIKYYYKTSYQNELSSIVFFDGKTFQEFPV